MTPSETREYLAWSGSTTVAWGHIRRALVIGIAECTPNRRASYVADRTTPRVPPPPTITGVPFSSGRSSSDTDA